MNKTVLIVEDNELNMKLFNDLLEAHGFDTLLELARIHRPNLILMDIQLPEVSGEVVIQWIKADETIKHIPIVAVTAFAMKGDEERILSKGCEAYLSKPISIMKFIEVVKLYVSVD
jgi:two-component system cell cycle response regulator DivK